MASLEQYGKPLPASAGSLLKWLLPRVGPAHEQKPPQRESFIGRRIATRIRDDQPLNLRQQRVGFRLSTVVEQRGPREQHHLQARRMNV